jgi:nitrous oxidase accessory protein NosD
MKRIALLTFLIYCGLIGVSNAQTYCTSNFSFPNLLWTSNVTFGSINNNSGASGYADYTSQSIIVQGGTTYPISVSVSSTSSSPAHVGIYVDWNQDFDFFDPGEYYYLGYNQAASGTTVLTGNISVPITAQTGPTRMRVLMRYGTLGFPTDPCWNSSLGETEDYTVFVSSSASQDIGVVSIDSPSVFCAGTENILATLRNFGASQVTTATVNWEVDGVGQTPFSFTGTLDTLGGSGSTTAQLNIGSWNFVAGTSYDIKVWSSNPNGFPDTLNSNDTTSGIFQSSLQGNLSIGGGGADYMNLADAANSLNTFGVCGPVNFTINPGIDSSHAVFSNIQGVSSLNTITFDGIDKSIVTLTNDGLVQNATILLDGANWISFKNLTIENTKTAWSAWGVRLTNEANHNTIENCNIKMAMGPNSDRVGIIATNSFQFSDGEGNNANYTQISNCVFTGGYEGIHFEGSSSQRTVGNVFINNSISNIEYNGIFGDDQDSSIIEGNTITEINHPSGSGMRLEDFERFKIDRNYIHVQSSGLHIRFPNTDSIGFSVLSNNMVISEAGMGIFINGGALVNIFHNSSRGEPGIYFSGSIISHNVKNNIFTSVDDFAFETTTTGTFYSIDHNIYNSNSPTKFVYYGGSFNALNAWQVAYPTLNVNSIEGDPFYKSSTDLRPLSPIANNEGDSVGIQEDFDGSARSIYTPDIGSIEYDILSNDIGVVSIDSPLAFCPGIKNVIVSIQNFGNTQINSYNINWTINGVLQSAVPITILLDTFGGTGPFLYQDTLGSYNFLVNTSYTIQAWTGSPNGGSDPNAGNDSTSVLRKGALAGTLTIGGPGADFSSFSEAATDLMLAGVCGPLVFNINPGLYSEFVELGEIDGASAINNIIFDGGNWDSVSIVHNGVNQNSVFFLNGSDWITLKNLSIENTYSAAGGWGVLLSNQADHNTIDKCRIVQPVSFSFNRAGIVSSASSTSATSEGNNANFTTVSNCHIIGGYTGIHFEGQSSSKNVGNRALNNVIEKSWQYGINADEQDSAIYKGNHISDLRSTGSTYGMSIYDHNGFIIDANYIQAKGYGMRLNDANSDFPMGTSLIVNNMVIGENNQGLYIFDANTVDIYHNSFVGEPGIALLGTHMTVDVQNNIFSSIADYAFETSSALPLSLDNNIYHSLSGTFFVKYGINYPDLATWQVAYPLLNINSLSGDPGFLSPTDLHLIGALANDSGAVLGVLQDFDGDTRSTTNPDIGADEYTPAAFDMAVISLISPTQGSQCFNGSTLIELKLKNLGSSSADFSLDSMVVTVFISGPNPDTVSTTLVNNSLNGGLPLAPGNSIIVPVGNMIISNLGNYGFDQLINFVADEQPLNDFNYNSLSLGVISSFPYLEDFESFTVAGDGTGFTNGWLNQVPIIPTTAAYRWVVNIGGTPNFASGPSASNTTGKYIYTKSASPGFDAQFSSSCISVDSLPVGKMDFYYHMFGVNMGILNIDVYNGTNWIPGLFTVSGQQHATENDPWTKATVDLSSFSGDVRVRFRGTKASGNQGDISVDNVRFYSPPATDISVLELSSPVNKTCLNGVENVSVSLYNSGFDSLDFSTNNLNIKVPISGLGSGIIDTTFTNNAFIGGTPLPPGDTIEITVGTVNMTSIGTYYFDLFATLTGDMDNNNDSVFNMTSTSEQIYSSFPYLEDFEFFTSTINATGWANGWTADPNNTTVPFRWQPDHDGTPTGGTGPVVDHSLGDSTGKYIYTEASSGVTGSEAILNSPCFDISSLTNPMMEFYYHMFGTTIGSMVLDVYDGNSWNLAAWTLTGSQQAAGSDPWLKASVNLSAYATSNLMRYRLRGIRGNGNSGDMAIDDAKFKQTPVNDLETNSVSGINTGCGLGSNETILVEVTNLGLSPASGFDIEYNLGASWVLGTTVTTPLASGASQYYTIPGVDLSTPGNYCIEARVIFALDEDSTNDVSPTHCIEHLVQPSISSSQGDEVCKSGPLNLSVVSNADSVKWYDDPALTNRVYTGMYYFIPNATSTQIFYVTGVNLNGCATAPDTVVGLVSQDPIVDFTFLVNGGLVDFTSAISGPIDSVFWDFGDFTSSTQLDPSHTYTNTQTYLVTHTGYNGSCFADTSKGLFVIVGLHNYELEKSILIYPNPSDGQFMIEIPQNGESMKIEIMNLEGKLMYQEEFLGINELLRKSMDLRSLSAGTYLIKVVRGDEIAYKRISIQ